MEDTIDLQFKKIRELQKQVEKLQQKLESNKAQAQARAKYVRST